jgi:hypothetical protein
VWIGRKDATTQSFFPSLRLSVFASGMGDEGLEPPTSRM